MVGESGLLNPMDIAYVQEAGVNAIRPLDFLVCFLSFLSHFIYRFSFSIVDFHGTSATTAVGPIAINLDLTRTVPTQCTYDI